MKKLTAIILSVAFAATMLSGCTTKSTAGASIKTAEDLAGKNIGVQSGTTGDTWVTDNATGAKIVRMNSGMDCALDLKNGAIDAIVLDELPAKAIVEKNDDLKILDIKFAKEKYAIAVKKGNTELIDKINKTIAEMKENGEYEELVNAFMPADGKIVVPADILNESSKTIKLGTNAAFPPFEYAEGTKIVGFDITMGQKIAATVGAKLEVQDMKFDSLIPALSSGSIDFIAAGMSVTEERLKNVDFSDTYFESEQVIIVKK